MTLHKVLFASILSVALLACSTTRETGWETTGDSASVDAGSAARAAELLDQAKTAWDRRSEPKQAQAAIDALKAAIEIDPTNADALVNLSHALYFNADCHLRGDESKADAYKNTHEEGVTYAEQALAVLSPEFAEQMAKGARFEEEPDSRDGALYWSTSAEDSIDLLDATAVPALYWRSANLGRWASLEGFATLLSYKDEVRALMEFCLANDPTYWFRGPDRYFGVFYARVSGAFGGNMQKSAEHFATAMDAYPDYWSTSILMAEEWAVKEGNREAFEQLVDYVLAGDPNTVPSLKPENECEQRKATALKAATDDLFVSPTKRRADVRQSGKANGKRARQ